jgi:hypothetical protein
MVDSLETADLEAIQQYPNSRMAHQNQSQDYDTSNCQPLLPGFANRFLRGIQATICSS